VLAWPGSTAAHELVERGFDVAVFEARDMPGGKARSMPVPGSGTGGGVTCRRSTASGSSPGFYRHLPDTMRRRDRSDPTRLTADGRSGADLSQANSTPGPTDRTPSLAGAEELRRSGGALGGRNRDEARVCDALRRR